MRFVVILGALGPLAPLSIDMYLPALPALGRDFDAGTAQIQLTLSSFLIGLALGQIVAGPVSDARGRRRPLLIGLAAYAAASLLWVPEARKGANHAPRAAAEPPPSCCRWLVSLRRTIVRSCHGLIVSSLTLAGSSSNEMP